jgi:hypothetical protein
VAADAHYEFLLPEERAELLADQQHLLEKEHYVNSLNLRAARELGDIEGAEEQIALAQTNLELIERKLAFLRGERARLDPTHDPVSAGADGSSLTDP